MSVAIEFNHVSKQYRLGVVSTRTLSHDLNRWWQMNILRREDPYLKIGSVNDRSKAADSEYVWALKDIDFKVEQGDVVGIIGKNGAGKSTLLKLLSRVTGPTTGSIRAKGRIGSLLEVGTGFHPEMTGRENIYMNGAILGMTRQEISQKLDEIIDFSGCERYIDTPIKRYSSGMTVRLGFAVAAFLDPEILVVDEVLAVGDAEFQKKAIGKMKDVSGREGRTILFVSHNMLSIRALCKTGLLLEQGMVKYQGDISDVVNRYLVLDEGNEERSKEIAERKDRWGSGHIKVVDVCFKNKYDSLVKEVLYGDFLRIELKLAIRGGFDTSDVILSCGFEDLFANRVVEWVSDELDHGKSIVHDKVITMDIPSVTLRPNSYNFFFKLMQHDTMDHNICDTMHFVRNLDVLPTSTFVNGMKLKAGRGYESTIPAKI